ncbi:hypothetical protein BU23DRAFT_427229, partial [Bimuria novae-zelandiae CBS 107.79]
FQIISDLHLETPLASPSYTYFSQSQNFPIYAPNLCLLGDIGLAADPALFTFLRTLFTRSPTLRIFYILGNHECYTTTWCLAEDALDAFDDSCASTLGPGRFFFMSRRRVDISPRLTLLGCTLWSHISAAQTPLCARKLMDFHPGYGIRGRSIAQHNADHAVDLVWLNSQISTISNEEPEREVVVLTHHCPTVGPRAASPRHKGSAVSEAFATDLRTEACWKSGNVRIWAWGHTHFDCVWGEGGRVLVSRQKGY